MLPPIQSDAATFFYRSHTSFSPPEIDLRRDHGSAYRENTSLLISEWGERESINFGSQTLFPWQLQIKFDLHLTIDLGINYHCVSTSENSNTSWVSRDTPNPNATHCIETHRICVTRISLPNVSTDQDVFFRGQNFLLVDIYYQSNLTRYE